MNEFPVNVRADASVIRSLLALNLNEDVIQGRAHNDEGGHNVDDLESMKMIQQVIRHR